MSADKEEFEFDFEPDNVEISDPKAKAKAKASAPSVDATGVSQMNTRLLDAIAKKHSADTGSSDDVVEIEKMKKLICRYKASRFGGHLADCRIQNYNSFENLRQSDLQALLDKISYHVSTKSVTNIGTEAVLQAVGFGEAFLKGSLPILDGYTNELRQDEMFLDGVEEYTLKTIDLSIKDPKKKIGFACIRCFGKLQQKRFARVDAVKGDEITPQVISSGGFDLSSTPAVKPPQ